MEIEEKKSLFKRIDFSEAKTALTTIFLFSLFIILPFFAHNAYFDIRLFKNIAFYSLSGTYLLIMGAVFPIIGIIKKEGINAEKQSIHNLLFFAFAFIGIISTAFSGFFKEELFANNNRDQGVLAFIIYCALLFFISRYGKHSFALKYAVLLTLSGVCIFGILNQFNIDPLRFYSTLTEGQRIRFISTIGNTNFYDAYCLLLFPIPLFKLLRVKNLKETALYSVLTVIALLGTISARTEGALLGLLVIGAITPLFCEDAKSLKRFFVVFPLLLLVMKIYQCAIYAFGGINLSSTLNILLSPLPLFTAVAIFTVIAFAIKDIDDEKAKKVKNIYKIIFFSLLSLAILAFVLINLFFADYIPQKLIKYLVITPQWGTDRGAIYKKSIEVIKSFNPIQLLFGGGFGQLARYDIGNRLFSDYVVDSAHNEYLHYIITNGIVGTALYVAFFIRTVIGGIKERDGYKMSIACGLIVYASHAMVGFAQVFTTPLFFTMLFLLPCKNEEENPTEKKKLLIYFSAFIISLFCLFMGRYRTGI